MPRNQHFRGRTVPEFSVVDLDGRQHSPSKLRGKVFVITFWATWCGPCVTELPRIESELWQGHHGDIPVLAIARGEDEQTIRKFNASAHLTFPLIADPGKRIYSLFASELIPRTYVVDRSGRVVHQSAGYSPATFAATLQAVDAASRGSR